MKTLLELYTLLLEQFKETYHDDKKSGFICHSIGELKRIKKISSEEYSLLLYNFYDQRPTSKKYRQFYEHPLFCNSIRGEHFPLFSNIKDSELAYALRVQLLTNIIADLKDASN